MEKQPDARASHGISFGSSQASKVGSGIGHENGSQGERIGSNSKTSRRTLLKKSRGKYQVTDITIGRGNWGSAVDEGGCDGKGRSDPQYQVTFDICNNVYHSLSREPGYPEEDGKTRI